eukprot:TRINITY_DN4088_c2_g1_i1.p1 TRINITY_DN4088_c2_g1~~TRINITY_DN4088_c2_g1_i1.p1  ORF type:complete len:215 (+),score=63.23 TRINITY_DN4088_c2_g1_i1:70-714(+)
MEQTPKIDITEKRKQFLRIYDTEMRKELHIPTLLATLETLSKVLNNIINNPDQEKFRKIPVTSKMFQINVIDKKGGKSLILACGFVRRTIEDKDYWVFPQKAGDIDILKLACSEVVDKRRLEIQEQNELEKRRDELEKIENAKRAEKAKRDFQEDRANFSEKVEMTGGVKDSVAIEIVDRNERVERMRGPPPGGNLGGPPPPATGHVLGGDDEE